MSVVSSGILINMDASKLKMYICVKKSLASHKVLGVAHGVLMAHLKFGADDTISFAHGKFYREWLKNSFRKVVCEVTDKEFEELKQTDEFKMGWAVVVTESYLDNQEIAIVFCPQPEWPKCFKFFPLLKV